MPDILIEDLARARNLTLTVNGAHPTFLLRTEAIAAAALHGLDPASNDFLEIAAAVFHADGELGRGGETRPEFGRDWHRNLRITIPVRLPALWSSPEVCAALTETVRFLTDDQIAFRFIQREDPEPADGFLDLDPRGAAFVAEEVILFSGGLDSFAGALEALATGTGKVLLVSHRSAPKVHARQDKLAAWLADRFPGRIRHVRVTARRVGAESHETTQRSRSLLFAAIGHAVAASFGTHRVNFYENGIVSHNLPISPQVVGTMATRTTHPQSIALLNRLLTLIAPASTRIANPYQWLTKTEVVERIARNSGTAMIGTAVSCTRVRDQTILHTHCGRCSQCLDRRFAILAAGLQTHDPEESYLTDVLLGTRPDGQSRTLAVEWTRHAVSLKDISERDFARAFGTEVSRLLEGFPAEQRADAFRQTLEMHRRHGFIVHRILQQSISQSASEIADHRIDPNCLINLWISDRSAAEPDLDIKVSQLKIRADAIVAETEPDKVLSPDGPLTATFFMEMDRHIVAVAGLARVQGPSALVAHLLKDIFLEDRANNLTPHDHRHVLIYSLPGTGLSKDAVKQNVHRCRKMLAAAYEDIFGHPPSKPLLIESGGRSGHRLDPLTVVIER